MTSGRSCARYRRSSSWSKGASGDDEAREDDEGSEVPSGAAARGGRPSMVSARWRCARGCAWLCSGGASGWWRATRAVLVDALLVSLFSLSPTASRSMMSTHSCSRCSWPPPTGRAHAQRRDPHSAPPPSPRHSLAALDSVQHSSRQGAARLCISSAFFSYDIRALEPRTAVSSSQVKVRPDLSTPPPLSPPRADAPLFLTSQHGKPFLRHDQAAATCADPTALRPRPQQRRPLSPARFSRRTSDVRPSLRTPRPRPRTCCAARSWGAARARDSASLGAVHRALAVLGSLSCSAVRPDRQLRPTSLGLSLVQYSSSVRKGLAWRRERGAALNEAGRLRLEGRAGRAQSSWARAGRSRGST